MHFPKRITAGNILCRLPLTPSTVNSIKGITNTGIITGGGVPVSPSTKQRQFYFDMMTDMNGQLQAKVKVLVEVVQLPEGDEDVAKNQIVIGAFWALKSFSVIDSGIELNEDGESGYWYFYANPKHFMLEATNEEVKDAYEAYAKEDIFIQDMESNKFLEELKKESLKSAPSLPKATMKSPILTLDKGQLHTM